MREEAADGCKKQKQGSRAGRRHLIRKPWTAILIEPLQVQVLLSGSIIEVDCLIEAYINKPSSFEDCRAPSPRSILTR